MDQVARAVFLPKVGLDVPFLLLLQDLVDRDQDAGLLHLAKLVIDGGAEDAHLGREVHVGVDQWRHVDAELAHLLVEHPVIVAEIIVMEQAREPCLIPLDPQGHDGRDQLFRIREMVVQEIEDQVARLGVVRIIHGDLAEEIPQLGVDHRQGAQPVPQVVEDKEALRGGSCRLILEGDKRASQLDGIGQDLVDKLRREVEEVRGGEDRLPPLVAPHIGTADEPVAAQDLLLLGAPDDQLPIGAGHRVELINIEGLARATAVKPERDLAEPPDLAHDVGRILRRDDVDLVARFVRASQTFLFRELCFQQVPVYRINNVSHILSESSINMDDYKPGSRSGAPTRPACPPG